MKKFNNERLSSEYIVKLKVKDRTYSVGLGEGLKIKVRPNKRKEFHGRYYSRLAPNGADY